MKKLWLRCRLEIQIWKMMLRILFFVKLDESGFRKWLNGQNSALSNANHKNQNNGKPDCRQEKRN